MMNRRNFIGSVAGLAIAPTLGATEHTPQDFLTSRAKNYRKYVERYHTLPQSIKGDLCHLIDTVVYDWRQIAKGGGLYSPIGDTSIAHQLAVLGDVFIAGKHHLVPALVYRIETIKGTLVEYQESMNGPDYAALSRCPVTKAHEDLECKAIRYRPDEIVHMKIDNPYHPYGLSLLHDLEFLDGYHLKNAYREAFINGMMSLKEK